MCVGTLSATLVSLFDFPMRRFFEWALLLPMAMPAYVVAYAYTDFLQYSGPMQAWLRTHWQLQGRVLPEIRNAWGAAVVFTFVLYPYVYLLVRAALSQRALHLLEAARLLGANATRRIRCIALPLCRPAIAAGVALALMETLADFGLSSYFGIQTFTTGIYKAWLVMDERIVAAQLSSVLLVLVAAVLWMEQRAQARLRFSSQRAGARPSSQAQPIQLLGWRATAAWATCAIPVCLGFVLPVLFLLRAFVFDGDEAVHWDRFIHWTCASLSLGVLTACLATLLAIGFSAQSRLQPSCWSVPVSRLVGLGYAVPGAVIVVGLLLPLGWLQQVWPSSGVGYWLTATVLGVLWAYCVRFLSVAMQSVQAGYARIPANMDESARTLGSGSWRLAARVHAPLMREPIFAALLLVFVDVMKELPATLVLRPFNMDTLAVMAYQLARDERLAEAALPSLALVAVGLLPILLLNKTLRAP